MFYFSFESQHNAVFKLRNKLTGTHDVQTLRIEKIRLHKVLKLNLA